MRREDGYQRREDEPTRPVRVPRLSTIILNDTSRVIKIDPSKDPTPAPESRQIDR
jgi:hypothetical protein